MPQLLGRAAFASKVAASKVADSTAFDEAQAAERGAAGVRAERNGVPSVPSVPPAASPHPAAGCAAAPAPKPAPDFDEEEDAQDEQVT